MTQDDILDLAHKAGFLVGKVQDVQGKTHYIKVWGPRIKDGFEPELMRFAQLLLDKAAGSAQKPVGVIQQQTFEPAGVFHAYKATMFPHFGEKSILSCGDKLYAFPVIQKIEPSD